jgi:hypothetical protein
MVRVWVSTAYLVFCGVSRLSCLLLHLSTPYVGRYCALGLPAGVANNDCFESRVKPAAAALGVDAHPTGADRFQAAAHTGTGVDLVHVTGSTPTAIDGLVSLLCLTFPQLKCSTQMAGEDKLILVPRPRRGMFLHVARTTGQGGS